MEKLAPTVENILAVLPAMQESVRAEIAERIAAGEMIVSDETPEIQARISARRLELMNRKREARKSAA
jgi:hypothetical protein